MASFTILSRWTPAEGPGFCDVCAFCGVATTVADSTLIKVGTEEFHAGDENSKHLRYKSECWHAVHVACADADEAGVVTEVSPADETF